MIGLRTKTFAIMMTAFMAGIANAWAQDDWIAFYPITGEVIFNYDGRWTESQGTQTVREIELEERLRLQLGGYSLDPRFLNFNVNLEPALSQTNVSSATSSEDSDDTFLNYSGRFSFLHGAPRSPVSLAGSFSGTRDKVDGDLGTRRDITTETRQLDLNWKQRAFPSTLSYLERALDETFAPAFGNTVERDELQRTLRFRGRSSKMELFLEGIEFDGENRQNDPSSPPVPPTITDYQSGEARLNNYWRWGKGSRFSSRLRHFTRDGFNAFDRTNVDETLHLQHLSNLFSSYTYSYEMLDRTVRTTTNAGTFQLNHKYYNNLTTNFRLDGSASRSDQFSDDDYSGNLDFYYRKTFADDVNVNTNLGGGYRVSDRSGGPQDFSETRVVDATGIVILTQRFIIVSTIIVTAPGCNPCVEGLDYVVESAGGDFTQLNTQTLVVPSTRITIGDTITVDYTFDPPTAKFYGIPYRIGARVDIGWASVFHRTNGEDQNFISGPDPDAVGDQRTDTTGIEFRWTNNLTRLSASAERRYTLSINFDALEYTFRQNAYHNFAPNFSVSANISETFLSSNEDSEAYNADLTFNWYPVRGLWVSPFASAFYRRVEPSSDERYWKVGANTRWNVRRLAFDLRYDHTDQFSDGNTRVDDRLFFSVRRRF